DQGADAPVSAAVDNSVDESRDGIYVSRETVRSHPSDPAGGADPSYSDDADDIIGDESSGEDVATDDSADARLADYDSDVAADSDDNEYQGDDLVPVPGTTFGEIELDLIRPNPRQPRDVFDEDALDELVTSIR